MKRLFDEFHMSLGKCLLAGRAFVCVTIVRVEGHVPQNLGAKAIVDVGGLVWGTVGGGKIEVKALAVAREILQREKTDLELVRLDLQKDLQMTCGGSVTLLFEPCLTKLWHVAVFGAGHVGQALVPLLRTLDCQLLCVDQREEWTGKLPKECRVIRTGEPAHIVQSLPPQTFYVVATQGHATDLPIVEAVLQRKDFAYLGVIGSSVKGRALKAKLLAAGYAADLVEKIRTPMGLPIGSNAPPEIAISIAAELLAERDLIARRENAQGSAERFTPDS